MSKASSVVPTQQ